MLSLIMNWLKVYNILYSYYGPQGWWPLLDKNQRLNSREVIYRYHPSDYSHPCNPQERFEIAVGAILTQNTTFSSVTECLIQLYCIGQSRLLNPFTAKGLLSLPLDDIVSAITPARYPNRKSEYLISLAEFFLKLKNKIPKREELLSIRGVGEETADTILLYAFSQPEFVIDAYTHRIISAFNHNPKNYQETKMIFENSLSLAIPDYSNRVHIYQEYHALLVTHAKKFYSRKINGQYGKDLSGNECFLLSAIRSNDKIIL